MQPQTLDAQGAQCRVSLEAFAANAIGQRAKSPQATASRHASAAIRTVRRKTLTCPRVNREAAGSKMTKAVMALQQEHRVATESRRRALEAGEHLQQTLEGSPNANTRQAVRRRGPRGSFPNPARACHPEKSLASSLISSAPSRFASNTTTTFSELVVIQTHVSHRKPRLLSMSLLLFLALMDRLRPLQERRLRLAQF